MPRTRKRCHEQKMLKGHPIKSHISTSIQLYEDTMESYITKYTTVRRRVGAPACRARASRPARTLSPPPQALPQRGAQQGGAQQGGPGLGFRVQGSGFRV